MANNSSIKLGQLDVTQTGQSRQIVSDGTTVFQPVNSDISGNRILYSGEATVTRDGDFQVLAFETPGSASITPNFSGDVEILAVGGGGGGTLGGLAVGAGTFTGGGGGAGEYVASTSFTLTSGSAVTIVVGAKGIGEQDNGGIGLTSGLNSQIGSLTALGGGAAGSGLTPAASSGGSGGGAGGAVANYSGGGSTASDGTGNAGGANGGPAGSPTYYLQGGGGGGASAAGDNTGAGGNGTSNDITGTSIEYAQGGNANGSGQPTTPGSGGNGVGDISPANDGVDGIVIVRFKKY